MCVDLQCGMAEENVEFVKISVEHRTRGINKASRSIQKMESFGIVKGSLSYRFLESARFLECVGRYYQMLTVCQ